METIFAEATVPGKGGIAVVRLSGPDAWRIATDLAGTMPLPRQAAMRRIADGYDVIDTALMIAFAEASSFTGEKVVEFHLHGVPVVVDRLASALRTRGARQAQAGEFTRRAFVNGRLDLTEVQGLSDLLAAETEAQRRLAIRNASGELGILAARWREDLVVAASLLIAAIDFPDEDTGIAPEREALEKAEDVRNSLEEAIKGAGAAEIVRRGTTVAIIGPPNSGKSTLLNTLSRRDVAIVSDTPGTTRDVIEVHLDLGGHAVTLLDTAGLRNATEVIEAEGVARARQRARDADFRIHLSETGNAEADLYQNGDIVAVSKADLRTSAASPLRISARTGEGVDDLVQILAGRIRERVSDAGLVAHGLQRDQIDAAAKLLSGLKAADPEIMADAIGGAIRELEALLGRVRIDEQLDVIFSRFCIGK